MSINCNEMSSQDDSDLPINKKRKLSSTNKPILIDLPPHLLENILKYNYRNRNDLKLVCKTFYEAICKIYDETYWLKFEIDDIVTQSPKKIKAILNPLKSCRSRNFKNLKISLGYIHDKKKFCNEFWKFMETKGEFINKLHLQGEIRIHNLIRIIENVKNLNELTFRDIKILPQNFEILDLHELLKLSLLTVEFCTFFDLKKLKLNDNVLETFNFDGTARKEYTEADFRDFFSNQNALRHVNFDYSYSAFELTDHFLENCKLESFSIKYFHALDEITKNVLEKIINVQKNLKVFDFNTVKIWDDLLMKLPQNLEVLKANFSTTSSEAFASIQNLKNLQVLEISYTNLNNMFKNVIEIPVKSLSLLECVISHENSIKNLALSFQNLKSLKMRLNFDSRHFDYNQILEKFDQVEEIYFHPVYFKHVGLELSPVVSKNINLKILIFQVPIKLNLNYLNNFENLSELEIFVDNKDKNSQKNEIMDIFSEFKHLQKVFITFVYNYRIDFDILSLVDKNPNLRIVYFSNINFSGSTITRNIRKYHKLFDIVEMNCEKEVYNTKCSFSILFAKNEEILMECRKRFEKTLRVCLNEKDFFDIKLLKIYKQCLNL